MNDQKKSRRRTAKTRLAAINSRSNPLGIRGVAIRCRFCPGQEFRRSRLRARDFVQILLMRYPVRCLYCNQRQMASFTVAGVSLPSQAKHERPGRAAESQRNWTEPERRHPNSSNQ